jgi:spectinomycin phosphotransferase
VAPWVDAPPALGSRTTPAHWTAVGALLAAVHATAVPPDLAAVLPRAGDRTAAARSARLRGLAGPAPDPWTADVLALTDELLAAARRLGARLSGTPVLCHGDPHLGNLLAGPDGRVWLLDWDDAVLGPREVDLLHVLGGVLADDPVGPERQAAVAAGYGPLAPDPVALAWARCLRAVEDVCDLAADAIDPALPPAARERGRALVEGSRPGIVAQARASLRELY